MNTSYFFLQARQIAEEMPLEIVSFKIAVAYLRNPY
jgi:hypothetical protein